MSSGNPTSHSFLINSFLESVSLTSSFFFFEFAMENPSYILGLCNDARRATPHSSQGGAKRGFIPIP
jgi:hypothetical protein